MKWVHPHVKDLAQSWSCGEIKREIARRGDKKSMEIMYDGFYLTRGYHANNASGTIHDVKSGKIVAFAHRSKRGLGSNWVFNNLSLSRYPAYTAPFSVSFPQKQRLNSVRTFHRNLVPVAVVALVQRNAKKKGGKLDYNACADSYQSQTVKKERKLSKTRWSNFFGDVFWAKRKDQNILYNPTYRFFVLSLNTNAIKQSVLKTPFKAG